MIKLNLMRFFLNKIRPKTLTLYLYCLSCLTYLAISLETSQRAFAYPRLHSFGVKIPTRVDHQRFNQSREVKASRYQLQLSADLEVSLIGGRDRGLQLITLIGSGDSFTSQWSNIYDFTTHEQRPLELSMRQLYLHYLDRWGRVSMGVIPPNRGFISNTSMDSDGWVRGARIALYLGRGGELEGVTGSVGNINDPSVFQTPDSWNYHKVEWTQPWLKPLKTRLGATLLKRARIARGQIRYHFKGIGEIHYGLNGELLYDFKAKRYAYDLMLELKKSSYRLRLEYSLLDERFGILGTLVNDYFSLGSVKMIALDGPTAWDQLRWFTRMYHSDKLSRGMLGMTYSFKMKR